MALPGFHLDYSLLRGAGSSLEPAVVVMAKAPIMGQVKTRLMSRLTTVQAAEVHTAMMQCVIDRLTRHLSGAHVLAVAGPGGNLAGSLGIVIPSRWRIVSQGPGNLGQRLERVWLRLGGRRAAFFGIDSPDVPVGGLARIWPVLSGVEATIGPVADGGYWTLASRRYAPGLFGGIDWNRNDVYHQTRSAARLGGVRIADLLPWFDVDEPADLEALRRRLEAADEPPLCRLRERLRRICQE